MTDYSRFYLCGSNLIGHQLCCVDCDEDDRLPWLTEDPALDLGEMVRMADEHVAERHPDGQPEADDVLQDDQDDFAATLSASLVSLIPVRPPTPEFTGVLGYLGGQP